MRIVDDLSLHNLSMMTMTMASILTVPVGVGSTRHPWRARKWTVINAHGVRVLDALAASIEEVAAGEAGT